MVKLESPSGGSILNSGSSSDLETKFTDSFGAKLLSVALIGPHEPRRWDVSSVLAECRGVTVREFASYPTALDDAPRLLERYFDVILVDLDSDREFALKLISGICAEKKATVMVYTENGDRELMARCMSAGAREYLVLPFDQGVLGKALDRARIGLPARDSSRETAFGDLLVFFGAKGGTGVTTIACNMAIALARDPDRRTLLIDLAVPLGDAALNLGIVPEHSTEDALRDPELLDEALLTTLVSRHRSGVFVLAAPGQVPEVEASRAAIDRLIAVARQQFDHVIVDVGSRIDLMGTDLFRAASTVYLVTQAGISELRNSNRLIAQFFSEGGPRLEIVLNRFAPHLQSGVNEEVVIKALGRPVRWKIPDDHDAARQMQSAADAASSAASPISRLILEMASSVTGLPISEQLNLLEEAAETSRQQETSSAVAAPDPIIPPQPQADVIPAIDWPSPEPISYGTSLGAVQLNATASVPGALVYTPGLGYLLPAGTHTLWVTFTPARSYASAPIQAAVSITVDKAVPAIAWPVPAEIPLGTALDSTHLNATAPIPGEFIYAPAAGEVLEVGEHTLSVTFHPADPANATSAEASVQVTVAKLTPELQWPEPGPMSFGESLGAVQLNASASVPGEFVYQPGWGEVLQAGTHTLTTTFHPADGARYSAIEASATVTVAKVTPVISWPDPESIIYGTVLGEAQLGASASVPGSCEYNLCHGALLAAGEHSLSVVFTPEDSANYETVRAAAGLTVTRAMPEISWLEPEPIHSGDALGAAQLNASATVPGSFAYSPAQGDILPPGSHTISVAFMPADSLNYTPGQATVLLDVVETSPVAIDWTAPSPISYGTPLGEAQLNATASAPGTIVYTPAAGHVLAPGRYTLTAGFFPEDPWMHAPAQASIELLVEDPANPDNPAEPQEEVDGEPLALAAVAEFDAPPAPEYESSPAIGAPIENTQRETRTYRGAVYEKGEDGQWHLQQK